jgi:hypothetical protein
MQQPKAAAEPQTKVCMFLAPFGITVAILAQGTPSWPMRLRRPFVSSQEFEPQRVHTDKNYPKKSVRTLNVAHMVPQRYVHPRDPQKQERLTHPLCCALYPGHSDRILTVGANAWRKTHPCELFFCKGRLCTRWGWNSREKAKGLRSRIGQDGVP